MTNVQSVDGLPNHVWRHHPLFIDWYISHDEEASWFGPFKSGNEVFVTLGNPLGDPGANPPVPGCQVPFRTVLYLATKGSTATGQDQCLTDTWANFSGRNVCRWHESTKQYDDPMYYYNGYTGVTSAAGMLASQDGNGQCHAWADLFKESLRANNVTNVKRTRVTPCAGYNRFGVKNLGFAGPPYTYPDDDPWFYEEDDLSSEPGIPGQNMDTPSEKLFERHFLVHRTGDQTYYDPSYGTTTAGPSAFTLDSVDAWESYISGDYHWRKRSSSPAVNVAFADEDF